MTFLKERYEIGSEFHWTGLPDGTYLPWPEPKVWFQSGRNVVVALWKYLSPNGKVVLHLPGYFCREVTDYWRRKGISIRSYLDYPTMDNPDWGTLETRRGDFVLAVNFFGLRDGKEWDSWKAAHENVILLEDHTHDPFSVWASNSKADYAFASIRKLFPVPDGAFIWSPCGHRLPAEPTFNGWEGSALKFAGMVLKTEYLKGETWPAKEAFRDLQTDGEHSLGKNDSGSLSPWSRTLLERGYPLRWRERRLNNLNRLLSYLGQKSSMRPLFTRALGQSCPFNAIFMFDSHNAREKTRSLLIQNKVYPAIHWDQGHDCEKGCLDISKRILTIPADQRYGETDIDFIASILLQD